MDHADLRTYNVICISKTETSPTAMMSYQCVNNNIILYKL